MERKESLMKGIQKATLIFTKLSYRFLSKGKLVTKPSTAPNIEKHVKSPINAFKNSEEMFRTFSLF